MADLPDSRGSGWRERVGTGEAEGVGWGVAGGRGRDAEITSGPDRQQGGAWWVGEERGRVGRGRGGGWVVAALAER